MEEGLDLTQIVNSWAFCNQGGSNMKSKFKIILSSDEGYEDLCAEIYYEGQFVAIITQEKGYENCEIEIHSNESVNLWIFNLKDFESTIQSAKNTLLEMRKIE